MKQKEAEEFVRELAPVFRKFIADAIDERVKHLQAQIDELKGRGLRYMGVYSKVIDYERGDVCTHDGSMWIANEKTHAETPGTGQAWILAVKRGRDAPTRP